MAGLSVPSWIVEQDQIADTARVTQGVEQFLNAGQVTLEQRVAQCRAEQGAQLLQAAIHLRTLTVLQAAQALESQYAEHGDLHQ